MKSFMRSLSASLIGVMLAFTPLAHADTPTPPGTSIIGGNVGLGVSTSSTRVQLPVSIIPFNVVTVYNSGASDAFVTTGSSTVTATVSNVQVPAGSAVSIFVGSNTYVAGITSTGSSNLVLYQATGPVAIQTAGGGAVNANLVSLLNALPIPPIPVFVTIGKNCHITTSTTTTCLTGQGTLGKVCLNSVTATDTITIYDNTAGSGTVLAVITTPATPQLTCMDYNGVLLQNGLTLVTAGATPQDISVSYKGVP